MVRNWYAVYTRPLKEKKVISVLNKRGIESYCPVVITDTKSSNKKQFLQPLFNSFVFVHISEADIPVLKSVAGVINFVYWRSKPAVVSSREIETIKRLTGNYTNIRLEKSLVDVNAALTVVDEPMIAYNENTVSVKYKSIRVNLPSLGFTMIAERSNEQDKAAYQQPSLISSFPRRINAFLFN